MRVSLKRAIQWTFCLAVLQIAAYYWTRNTFKRTKVSLQRRRLLKAMSMDEGVCSRQSCPNTKLNSFNVHLIPHSHIDVGWVKTVDQYYLGEDALGVRAPGCVRCILNATINELLKNKSRRFLLVEMKYLSRYWDEIDDAQRNVLRQLVKERRIELTNGGWVMSDAAVTTYNDIIDQHTLGFDFIRENFGTCAHSRTGWHIDQFGHSREHASIFAQMGYNSLFIGRIDFQDRQRRTMKKRLEFVWDTSPFNLKKRSSLFTHILYDGYHSPFAFNFELEDYNWSDHKVARQVASNFLKELDYRASSSRSNNILMTMGCDFGYNLMTSTNWFTNMDNLIKNVHEELKMKIKNTFHLFYSTPSCYTYYVNKEKIKMKVKTTDFHPYSTYPGYFWTGYFTTRGGLKMHIKKAGQILQSCKQMSIFTHQHDTFDKVNMLRDVLATVQHHDAITGTQTLEVLHDYNLLLSKAIAQCETVMSEAYQQLWKLGSNWYNIYPKTTSHFCPDLNISSCNTSEKSQKFLISLYNPLAWAVDVTVRFPVQHENVTVHAAMKSRVPVQLVSVPEGILWIPERESITKTEAVFRTNIPPMSVTSYMIKSEPGEVKPKFLPVLEADIVIENEHLVLTFHAVSGHLMSVHNKHSMISQYVHQDFAYYKDRDFGEKQSGMYLFVPELKEPTRVQSNKVTTKVIKGEVVQEVHQKFSNWVSQVVRLYKGSKFAEFQWVVGPLPAKEGIDVISRFKTSMTSTNLFYTDSNGRETMTRFRRKPSQTNLEVRFDHISGNYYPVTSRIFIKDKKQNIQLTILPDRPQGGSSLESGAIELMVHRRHLNDDALGVGEPLVDSGINEKGIVYTGKHYLCLDTIQMSSKLTKHLAIQLHLGPVPMFTHLDSSHGTVPEQRNFLTAGLPHNVHILTLDRISKNDTDFYLLRLEHVLEQHDNPLLSRPASVSLQDLFKPFRIIIVEETTLGGNFKPLDITVHKLIWNTVYGPTQSRISSLDYKMVMTPPFTITLQPMEIRTFRVQADW